MAVLAAISAVKVRIGTPKQTNMPPIAALAVPILGMRKPPKCRLCVVCAVVVGDKGVLGAVLFRKCSIVLYGVV